MNHSIACLHDDEVGRLLTGEVDAARTSELEQHLAECIECRQRLEQQVGDDGWWNETESSLRGQHVTASQRDAEDLDPHVASLGETRLRGTRIRESVLDLLGPTDDPNMLGRIGSYEIIGLLGQGGMGAVFKGFDRSLNRFVAIKMLLPHLAASGAARKRFAREGQAVAAVVDDHVMAIHCVDEWQGVPYLVMTYSRGVSLQKRLSDNGPLEVREILRIGMQAAKGLAAAHAQGIVHRDIKPANIFLDQSVERVQLMDFGLARAVDDASLTRSGTLAGTPQYMSPEQARAETVDHRSDLFSLGSVMYAMCTGHAPFRAESSYSVLRLITDKEPRPIREVNPDVPEWLCAITGKLMVKQADDRFSSAQEVAQLLEDCLAHVQQPTVKNLPGSLMKHHVPISGSSQPPGLVKRLKRFGNRAWLIVGISVMAFMLIAMMLQDNGPQRVAQDTSGPLTGAQANLNELLQQQKAREESIRQISYKGTVRQYAKQEIQRTNTESVDEFIARCVGLAPVYDDVPPYPMRAGRDFDTGVYRFTLGDINAMIPKYMDWFIDKKKYVQLMGRDPGACEAVITKNREDIQDDREASLVRLDIAAFRPVKDILMSEVLTKAISVPGIPDVGGRPLWKLEKLDNNKVGWKATFMFQQPIANPPGAKQILWQRVYWEQVGGELVIVRVDKLTVDGNEASTPQSVLLIDDYRSVCGKPVPFRVRFFGLGNKFVYGAELLVSDLKVNDYVDVPDQMQIPAGSPVRNHITGVKSRQPASKNSDPTTDAKLIQGTWNVLELQQVGYEASEDERNIYKNGGYKITFTKNKTIHSPDHSSMDYRLDTTQTPHILELLKSGKVIAKAIYELAGDDLKICQGRTPTDGSDPEPPTSFDINQAPTKFPSLYILRRTKPIEPIAIPMEVAAPEAATGTRASGPSGKQNPKRLQIREATVVEAETDSSLKPAENKVVEFSGILLRLNPAQPAILTEDDIMTVESVADPNIPNASQMVLTLTPEAGERFLIETTRLSSQPNPGYLVIEFDGIILSAPRVNDKISSKVAISFADRDKPKLESVAIAIREAIAPREKVAKNQPDARSVVEAYVAAALSGDIAKAAALAKNGHATADPKRIAEIPDFLNVQRLKIQTVYINDPANPKKALATSVAVKLDEEHKQPDGQRDGFMVFTLELTDGKWLVIDIDFESESGAEKELKRFLEANPNSIGLPPLTSSSMPNLNLATETSDDHDRIQGAWQFDSKSLPTMPAGNQFSVSFLADRMSFSGPQKAGIGTFHLSPDTVPKQIDCRLTFAEKQLEFIGIYEFHDDQLWLCLTEGKQRPLSFDNPPALARLMNFSLERKRVKLPEVDSNASLALSDWSQSQVGAGVFAKYTLSIPGIETISQGLAARGPAVKEFSGIPGGPEKVFTLRYFLPNLSPRGMEFVARNSFRSSLDLIELTQVAEHKRLVKVFSYPDSATEPIASNLTTSVLTAGANQADWLKEIDATGEIIYGYEVVVQNANFLAPPVGKAAKEAPAESPLLVEARKALQACQNSLSWKQKFDMRVTNSYVHSQVGKVTIESRVHRDAPRMVESSLQTFDDQPKDHIRLDDWRLDDGEMFLSRTTTVGHKKLTGLMTIKGRQKASWRMFESSSSFAMEGHFPGNQGRTLMELLMESKEPDVRMEKIGDHDCLRISDSNDWGTLTVWIDAGPSRRLRQWESSKERGNRFADGRVGEDKDTSNLESFSYFVEDIQYQVLDGIEIAVSCRLRSTSIPNGGTKQEATAEYKRTEIHLRPDFGTNNPFVGDFDNGARINDGDAFDRDTAFRWQDGKLTLLPNTSVQPSLGN